MPAPKLRPVCASETATDQLPSEPAPVESAVVAELDTLSAATDRPGVAQTALALARILDNPRAVSSQPPAAKVQVSLLDKMRSASVQGRRCRLSLVRTMTDEKRGA